MEVKEDQDVIDARASILGFEGTDVDRARYALSQRSALELDKKEWRAVLDGLPQSVRLEVGLQKEQGDAPPEKAIKLEYHHGFAVIVVICEVRVQSCMV